LRRRPSPLLAVPRFHYIQSLDFSIQCNTRSGAPPRNDNGDHIKACMSGAYAHDEAEKLKQKLNSGRESHAHESETRRFALEGLALPEGDDTKEEEEEEEEEEAAEEKEKEEEEELEAAETPAAA
jgi:hypothetical protein